MLLLFYLQSAPQARTTDKELLFFVLLVLLLILFAGGKRSRHISAKSKRLAKARFTENWYSDPRNEGKKFPNLKKYEYDHHHPFSLGGTDEPKSIRLITRKENRKKGAKTDSWFRF